MTLDRQFISAEIAELFPNCWRLNVTYSYYSLYRYNETFTFSSLEHAKDKLILIRCTNRIRVINKENVNVNIYDESVSFPHE